MVTTITIFTIITGTASFLGFLSIFFGKSKRYKPLCYSLFFLAFLWSIYILFFPGTSVTQKVADKISFYKSPTIEQPSSTLIIQRGDFSISGFEPLSIEFPYPFKDIPQVEVINLKGYDKNYIPRVIEVTQHQAVFKSSTSNFVISA